jgi:pyrimidine operon attenuation protein/uracil phosphoribosyltransferase
MPDVSKKVLILSEEQINKKLIRIAYQILEDNFEEKVLVLAGIADRGYFIAQRLKDLLTQIAPEPKEIVLLKVTVGKEKSALEGETDLPLSAAENKTVILVDDVLSSGRTLAYGMGIFFDIPLKKLRTAVLIDRSHHRFPIVTDFYGLKLSTTLKEHVNVVLKESGEVSEDAAWLA